MSLIIPNAEPFFLLGKGENSHIGCLVVHGFTGTPKEMRGLGEHLNGQGYTVCGIHLNGHATRPEDMIRCRWQDWLLSVEDGYHLLRSCTDKIFLVGLSMGGVLSLTAARMFPIRGMVAMSAFDRLPDNRLLPFSRPLSWFIPYLSKGKGKPVEDWFDKRAFEQHISYPKNPVHSAGELNKLLAILRTLLPQLRVPVLLIHSHDDHYVVEGAMDSIFERLGSSDKQKLWVEGGCHVITEEPTCGVVYQAAADFVSRVSHS